MSLKSNSFPFLKLLRSNSLSTSKTSTISRTEFSKVDFALEYCNTLVKYYERQRRINRNAYYISQVSAILFAGITPIFILIPRIPPNIQAMPPIIAALSTSLSIFRWHENWVQCKNTEEDLEFEKLKFIVKATKVYADVNEDVAISNFLDSVHTIHKSHLREWTKSRIEQLKKEKVIKTEKIEDLIEEKDILHEKNKKTERKLSELKDIDE